MRFWFSHIPFLLFAVGLATAWLILRFGWPVRRLLEEILERIRRWKRRNGVLGGAA